MHAHNGKSVGELHKEYFGFITECCSMADKYIFAYPSGADEDQKALMLSAIHFIDLYWFENNYYMEGGI